MWIARDSDGSVWLSLNKPKKGKYFWRVQGKCLSLGDDHLIDYPNVRWEDDEPIEVEITIKQK